MKFSASAASKLATGSYHWSPTNLLRRFLPITGGGSTSSTVGGTFAVSPNTNAAGTFAITGGGPSANTNVGGTFASTGAVTSATGAGPTSTTVGGTGSTSTVASRELVVCVLVPSDGSGESVVGTMDGSFRNKTTNTSLGTKDGSLPGGGIGVTENKLIMFTRDNTKTSVGQAAAANPTVPPTAYAFKFFKHGCPGMTRVLLVLACFLLFMVQPAHCMENNAGTSGGPSLLWTPAMWLVLVNVLKKLFHSPVPIQGEPFDPLNVASPAWQAWAQEAMKRLQRIKCPDFMEELFLADGGWQAIIIHYTKDPIAKKNPIAEDVEMDRYLGQVLRNAMRVVLSMDVYTCNFVEVATKYIRNENVATAMETFHFHKHHPNEAVLFIIDPSRSQDEMLDSIESIPISYNIVDEHSLVSSHSDVDAWQGASIKTEEGQESVAVEKEPWEIIDELGARNFALRKENKQLQEEKNQLERNCNRKDREIAELNTRHDEDTRTIQVRHNTRMRDLVAAGDAKDETIRLREETIAGLRREGENKDQIAVQRDHTINQLQEACSQVQLKLAHYQALHGVLQLSVAEMDSLAAICDTLVARLGQRDAQLVATLARLNGALAATVARKDDVLRATIAQKNRDLARKDEILAGTIAQKDGILAATIAQKDRILAANIVQQDRTLAATNGILAATIRRKDDTIARKDTDYGFIKQAHQDLLADIAFFYLALFIELCFWVVLGFVFVLLRAFGFVRLALCPAGVVLFEFAVVTYGVFTKLFALLQRNEVLINSYLSNGCYRGYSQRKLQWLYARFVILREDLRDLLAPVFWHVVPAYIRCNRLYFTPMYNTLCLYLAPVFNVFCQCLAPVYNRLCAPVYNSLCQCFAAVGTIFFLLADALYKIPGQLWEIVRPGLVILSKMLGAVWEWSTQVCMLMVGCLADRTVRQTLGGISLGLAIGFFVRGTSSA